MLSYLDSRKSLFITFYFILLFLIGIIVFKDYGISIDEDNTRINGFISLKYVFEIFAPNKVYLIDQHIQTPSFSIWDEHGAGVVFDLPLALIELIFKISDNRDIYLLRHFINFSIFYIAVCFFYFLIKKRFNSNFLAIFASSFLFFTPRIFAQSFYNSKDIFFLSLFIISIFFAIKFLDEKNFKSALIFSFFSAITIDVRVLGILLPVIIVLFYILNILGNTSNKKNHIHSLILFIFLLPLFIILFFPYLWSSPLENFIKVFADLSHHKVDVYNYYLGNYVYANNNPWHYPLIWILVTTPILFLIPFFLGFSYITIRIVKRISRIEKNELNDDLWRSKNEMIDLVFFSTLIVPLISVIMFGSTLYDGWRHLFFIYPSLLMISIYGLNLIKITFFKKKIIYFFIILFIMSLPHILWMYKNHPNQNVYFNFVANNFLNKKFELDYWGLSNKDALLYIAKKENNNVKIFTISTADLNLSKKILKKKYRNRIEIVYDIKEADYIISNHRDWRGKTSPYEIVLLDDFEIIRTIYVDDFIINTIYKRNDKISNKSNKKINKKIL